MEKTICELIYESKKGNKDSMYELIKKFMPLIMKYQRKLSYEDAESEIIEHFIKTVKKMPSMVESKQVRYIQVSIKNKYIELNKKDELYESRVILMDTMEEEVEEHRCEMFSMDMKKALKALSSKEKKILLDRYVYGFKDDEIGEALSISRQAVHKARKRALVRLDHYLNLGVV